MNFWLFFVLAVIVAHFILDVVVARLNLKALSPRLPDEFADIYDPEDYRRSQHYTRVTTRFGLLQNSISTTVTVIFLVAGGFNSIDHLARSWVDGPIVTGLVFTALLILLSFLLGLPFSIYSTFAIEARFGFNRTSPLTFFTDICKGLLVALIIGGPLLALLLWFFETGGELAWLYCWLGVVVFGIVLQFLAPVVIMPLFNKFTPLADGPLKERILAYVRQQLFNIGGIYTMDGSKRSTKLNAFFTGFGRFRKIVFFDTLLDKLDDNEIVAVLAHEMGHFKQRHIWKMMALSALQTGLLFFLLSLILENHGLFAAFRMDHVSIYASLVFFAFLYAPLNTLLGIGTNYISRRHEFSADRFAAKSTGRAESLAHALKRLSRENLSNLTPHPVAVAISYSHPPVVQRLEALRNLAMTVLPRR
ncbi:M48 family metallopeptidase [Desulfofustis glycolicus]|uniref:STE24 endopeptidase n=1 Tax=Desulfofustis glycolicus DSM 9705 TaxID=1121409 RepID=A0A1M5VTJ7_9BACT|nr:M48 family metallopeptidase [Desulfofustis glycolicus]SHH78537.1 STE24 endopeptidase [Desulfofustis glycolicus DSM 9705]